MKFMKRTLLILNDNKLSENFWYQFVDPTQVKIVLIKSLDELLSDKNLPEPTVVVVDEYYRKKGSSDWMIKELGVLKARFGESRVFCLSPLFGAKKQLNRNGLENCECYSFSSLFTNALLSALEE